MALEAYQRMQSQYEAEAAERAAKEKQAAFDAKLAEIPEISKGATTFGEIDSFLAQNPDAQFFRIGNGGASTPGARSYQTKYGEWSDNDAAIVGSDADKGARDIFRYANISAMEARKGKRGEQATIQQQYAGGDFFKQSGMDYKSGYGMVMSRDEYGKMKEWAAQQGAGDQFLKTYAKQPGQQPNLKGKGNVQAMADTTRRADDLGADTGASSLQSSEDTLTKRTLLG